MPIFPQLGPQYYDEPDKALIARMETSYAESITINQAFWAEADVDVRYEASDATLWNNFYFSGPSANRRRTFNFNRIRRIVNLIDGYQRRNRKSTIVVPVENGDDETASQFTKVLLWANQQDNILETISDAFRGSLITGMNLLQVWLDYRSDPVSGNIRVDNCSYNSFLIDPFFKKADLSDCNFLWKRSWLTKRECISLLPDRASDILGLIGNDNNRDGKFQFMPESYNYYMKNLLTYDEYYYRDYRTQKMLVDTQTGESTEWRGNDEEALRYFLQLYPQITVLDQEVPTTSLAIVVQGRVMYDGPNPMGIDQYPFVPVFTYYSPEMPYFEYRIQGVVRSLRDSQYLYNRRKSIELDILESQINSGWIYKENSLVNPKDVFLSGQGRGLALKQDAQMTDVQQIQAPQVPPSMIQLSQLLGEEINQISGVNEELLGSATDEKAGILSALRQGAGLTTLQILFDRLDRSQRQLGKLMIDIIQTNFTPGKIQKILEGQPTNLFYSKAFGRYDAMVEDGLNTTTQRQMQFAQLLQLREVGVQIPDDILLESCTVQNKTELLKAVQQAAQQQSQMQQMQMQSQMQEQQARTNLAHARAEADRGLGAERISRIEENKSLALERRAEAEKDKQVGLLNLVKAIKEIDTLDLAHLEQLLRISASIKNTTEQESAQVATNTALQQAKNKTPEGAPTAPQ